MAIFRVKKTPSKKMPANASRTTARKAYAQAVSYERRSRAQRANDVRTSWGNTNINKKKNGTGSLKIAGQNAAARQAYRRNTASWDKTRNAFKVK